MKPGYPCTIECRLCSIKKCFMKLKNIFEETPKIIEKDKKKQFKKEYSIPKVN